MQKFANMNQAIQSLKSENPGKYDYQLCQVGDDKVLFLSTPLAFDDVILSYIVNAMEEFDNILPDGEHIRDYMIDFENDIVECFIEKFEEALDLKVHYLWVEY